MQHLMREEFDTPYGVLKFSEFAPHTLRSDIPLLLASGWSETIESLEETVLALASIGRRVFVLDYSELIYQIDAENGFPASGHTKAQAFLALLDKKEIQKVDVIAHSEGAINATIAAMVAPGRFRSIIFVAPGGFMLRDNFFKLAYRFTKNILQTIQHANKENKESRFQYVKEVLSYFVKNPIQTLQEALAISRFRVAPLLADLGERGILTYVIHGDRDAIFPAQDVKEAFKEVDFKSFRLIPGGHNDLHAEPNRYAELISPVLQN